MDALLVVAIFVAFWGVLGLVVWWFEGARNDQPGSHLPPYRNEDDPQ